MSPRCLQCCRSGPVPSKGAGGAPLDLRPISVMSAVYRLWAGTRIRDVMQWQEAWLTKGQMGFRAGCACDDVYWAMALRAERAMLTCTCDVGLSADLAKAFDSVPHEIMLTLLTKLGMHPLLLRPIRVIYVGLRRRFRFAGAVGKRFRSTQGILQGCPLSVAALSAVLSIWSRAIEGRRGRPP